MPRPVLHRVETLDEAVALLAEHGPDAAVLSGGQSLIPMMSAGLASPAVLVDLNSVASAGLATRTADSLTLGACVRHRALEHGRHVSRAESPLLEPAAALIAHAAIRNRGTFVGSIAHADPAAEWPAVALALDAVVTLISTDGARDVPIADFFLGPMTTSREAEELLASVTIRLSQPGSGGAVCELSYRHGDYAVVGAAAHVTVDGAERLTDARLVLFGVDATPIRIADAERIAIEGGVDAFGEAAAVAAQAANPMDDATASGQYRRDMIPVIAERALIAALVDARAR